VTIVHLLKEVFYNKSTRLQVANIDQKHTIV
jgi:hypothetical protein